MGMMKHNDVKSLRVIRMEVPCCSELTRIAREALEKSGKGIKIEELVATIDGNLKTA